MKHLIVILYHSLDSTAFRQCGCADMASLVTLSHISAGSHLPCVYTSPIHLYRPIHILVMFVLPASCRVRVFYTRKLLTNQLIAQVACVRQRLACVVIVLLHALWRALLFRPPPHITTMQFYTQERPVCFHTPPQLNYNKGVPKTHQLFLQDPTHKDQRRLKTRRREAAGRRALRGRLQKNQQEALQSLLEGSKPARAVAPISHMPAVDLLAPSIPTHITTTDHTPTMTPVAPTRDTTHRNMA